MESVNESFKRIVDINTERLKIGVCYDDILWPSSINKPLTQDICFIKHLKQICSFKRVRKNQQEAREMQKQYDDNNIGIMFYQPNNKSRVNVYKLKPEQYTESFYIDIGTDPINI